jgi:hypothetical protein
LKIFSVGYNTYIEQQSAREATAMFEEIAETIDRMTEQLHALRGHL